MTTYQVYRNGDGDLEAHIKIAVLHFRQTEGRLPAAIVVNPAELADAEVVIAGGRGIMPAVANGGCLVGELWLQLSNDDKQPVAVEQGTLL